MRVNQPFGQLRRQRPIREVNPIDHRSGRAVNGDGLNAHPPFLAGFLGHPHRASLRWCQFDFPGQALGTCEVHNTICL